MGDIVVLAEYTSQVTAREEDRAGAIVPLETGLLAEVRRDRVYEDIRADQAVACCFEPVYAAKPWAEVAVAEVGVGERTLAGGIGGGEELVAGGVGV